jgi:hypothetical protein
LCDIVRKEKSPRVLPKEFLKGGCEVGNIEEIFEISVKLIFEGTVF